MSAAQQPVVEVKIHVTPLGIDAVAEKVEESLLSRAEDHWKDFIDEEGKIWIDEDGAFGQAFDDVIGSALPDEEYERVYELVQDHPRLSSIFKEMKIIIKDIAEEEMEYHNAMTGTIYDRLRYYGMSIHDFI